MEGEEVVASSTHLEQRPIDAEEERKISEFIESGCGCTMWKKGPCSRMFSREHWGEGEREGERVERGVGEGEVVEGE